MGTDIHLYVERKNWDGEWEMMMHEDVAYGERIYNVFAVLANVRNGSGFAGIKTGDGFNPISEPRGLPSDISPEVKRYMRERSYHSESYLTAAEVLGYDWTQTTRLRGVISWKEFLEWRKKEPRTFPEGGWSGAISGPNIVTVSEKEAELVAKGLQAPPPESVRLHVQVSWEVTYEEACSDFLQWVRGLFEEYDPDKDIRGGPFSFEKPEKVRFVFGFDS